MQIAGTQALRLTPLLLRAENPRPWRFGAAILFVFIVVLIATAGGSGGSGGSLASPFGRGESVSAELHFMRTRQGLDPEAVPSLALVGVSKSGATELYRRLLSRFPALQPGAFRELNFLTQCQSDSAQLVAYRGSHAHCEAGLVNGSADPACHGCSPLGYASLFNTSAVRARLGACDQPLATQSLCAGGQLLADREGLKEASPGYRPVFTVDASSSYSGSGGLAQRAATTLTALSPRTKVLLLLRSPVDLPRALYNAKLAAECGSHECSAGAAAVPSFQALIQRELAFLNTSAGAQALALLASASSVSAARDGEQRLGAAWASYAAQAKWPVALWGKSLYCLEGLYAPALLAWSYKFVTPGRPMLVVQSEAYFEDPPRLVDELFAPFLFGDADAATTFADGGRGVEPPALRPYGAKAAQTAQQRCALYELLRGPNKVLETLLTRLVKEGRVQLRRARPTGPLWPRPADCAAPAGAPASTESEDYLDYQLGPDQGSYSPDYDYAYTFTSGDYDAPTPAGRR